MDPPEDHHMARTGLQTWATQGDTVAWEEVGAPSER